jgi:hypothetical protein
MQTIKKDELFRNLGDFLKSKGIELNEGSYTTRIQKGCNLLADAINATQKTVSKTKVKVDHALDQLRQTIHESTAPPPPRETKGKTKSAPQAKRPKPAPKARRPNTGRKG